MTPAIHPFPARMAPELALNSLRQLEGGVVLDPMTGSGTVVRMAKARQLDALGFDLDPLAVLISKVGTTPVEDGLLGIMTERFMDAVKSINDDNLNLPWIDGDVEATRFVEFWFGERQRKDLRKIAFLLANCETIDVPTDVIDIFRIALSRIIVTKKSAASLADDTSHSRPHRVSLESKYDVFAGLQKSINSVRKRISEIPRHGSAKIRRGDARDLSVLADESVDAVLTSPPYLNAIDYLRGHRMSLIWLGHRYQEISKTRSESIGSERRPDTPFNKNDYEAMKLAIGDLSPLHSRHHGMIERYIIDLHKMMSEVARVLKPKCSATFVMGNSCLKGVFIQNSAALARAGELLGLGQPAIVERDLPSGSRYLPTPDSGALSKRMRKEVILTFDKA
jgi:IS1 family transposase